MLQAFSPLGITLLDYKEVCAVGAKTCCHRTWLVFTRPSSNDSKHLVPTAVVIELGVPDHFKNDLLPNPTLYLLSI